MARSVNGFLSKDGAFFNTYIECELYEATYDCREVTNKFIYTLLPAATLSERSVFADMLMTFVADNIEALMRYGNAVQTKSLSTSFGDTETAETSPNPVDPLRETGPNVESEENVHI